jgi:hypothetical protein
MSKEDEHKKYLIAEFKPFIKTRGGIFTRKTRERLLGTRVASGRDRTKNQFWYDVRNNVKNALKDLELFVETADKGQRDQVLMKDSLEPVVRTMLQTGLTWSENEPNPTKAEIADMLIRWGFNYLEAMTKEKLTLSHERTMNEALDLSNYLLSQIKGTRYSRQFEWVH